VAQGYLLDTNVLSETRRTRPDPGVAAFLSAADAIGLFLSVLTLGELRKGVAAKRAADGLAADRIAVWVDTIETTFADRLLTIDAPVASRWGELSAGRPAPVIDTLLAATAMHHGLTLVTRNVRDVEATGVAILNPWRDPRD
jgi:predicted nucleic acid-binding protein